MKNLNQLPVTAFLHSKWIHHIIICTFLFSGPVASACNDRFQICPKSHPSITTNLNDTNAIDPEQFNADLFRVRAEMRQGIGNFAMDKIDKETLIEQFGSLDTALLVLIRAFNENGIQSNCSGGEPEDYTDSTH